MVNGKAGIQNQTCLTLDSHMTLGNLTATGLVSSQSSSFKVCGEGSDWSAGVGSRIRKFLRDGIWKLQNTVKILKVRWKAQPEQRPGNSRLQPRTLALRRKQARPSFTELLIQDE